MGLDPSIFQQVGNFKSVQDYDQQAQAIKLNALHQMLLQGQVNDLPAQNQLKALQLAAAQRQGTIDQVFADRLGRGVQGGPSGLAPGSAAMAAGAAQNSIGPTVANAGLMNAGVQNAPSGQQGGDLGGIDKDTLALGVALGKIPEGFVKLWTENRFGRPMQPGYVQNMDGSFSYRGDPTKGITLADDGKTVVGMPGAAGVISSLAGATKGAETQAVNRETPLPLGYLGVGTATSPPRPIGGSIDAYLHPQAPQGAQGMAPAGPSVSTIDLAGNGQQRANTVMDLAKGGDGSGAPPTINGAPVNANPQQMLDAAKEQGPAAMRVFAQTMSAAINNSQMSPEGKKQALDGLQYDLYTPKNSPIHAYATENKLGAPTMGAAPMAGGQSRPVALAGPTDTAVATARGEAGVKMDTAPKIEGDTTAARDSATSGQKYVDDLNNRVREGALLLRRNNDITNLIEQVRTGIGGQHARTTLASNIKNLLPNSATAQALAEKVQGGDVASAQSLEQLMVGAGLVSAIQTLDKQGRLTKDLSARFMKASENPESDPDAIRQIMAIQNKNYEQEFAEQQALAGAKKAGNYDPRTWEADWSAIQHKGLTNPGTPSVFSPTTQPASAKVSSGGFKYLGKQ